MMTKRAASLTVAMVCASAPLAVMADGDPVVETGGSVRFRVPAGFTLVTSPEALAQTSGRFERPIGDRVVTLVALNMPAEGLRKSLSELPGESGPAPPSAVENFVGGMKDASQGALADLKTRRLLYDNDRKAYGFELEGTAATGEPATRVPFIQRYAVIHTTRATTVLRLDAAPADRPLLEAAWSELWNGFSIIPAAVVPRGIFSRLAFRQTGTAYLLGMFTSTVGYGIVGGLVLGLLVSCLPIRPLPGAAVAHVLGSGVYLSVRHDLFRDGSLTWFGLVSGVTCLVALPFTMLIPWWRRRRRRPA
jgi:hypothetical protein